MLTGIMITHHKSGDVRNGVDNRIGLGPSIVSPGLVAHGQIFTQMEPPVPGLRDVTVIPTVLTVIQYVLAGRIGGGLMTAVRIRNVRWATAVQEGAV